MTTQQIVVTIISSLISGLVGVGISTFYYFRHERRKDKMDVLRRFMGNRYDILGGEFSRALNEVFVVFKASPKVMQVLSDYHHKVTTRQESEDELVKLFKVMCEDVGFSCNDFNDSFFLKPFNCKPPPFIQGGPSVTQTSYKQ